MCSATITNLCDSAQYLDIAELRVPRKQGPIAWWIGALW